LALQRREGLCVFERRRCSSICLKGQAAPLALQSLT